MEILILCLSAVFSQPNMIAIYLFTYSKNCNAESFKGSTVPICQADCGRLIMLLQFWSSLCIFCFEYDNILKVF